MSIGITEILLLLLGLALVFFGLPLFRGALNVFGFVTGALYGLYLFALFAGQMTMEPLLKIALGALIAVVGGLVGTGLANFAQAIFVFLAGGLVGLLIAKLIAGLPVEQATKVFGFEQIGEILHLQTIDILWFAIGGIVFVLAMDTVMILALVALGSSLIYRALDPLNLMQPEWLIPVIIGILGFIAQESIRNRAHAHRKVVVVEEHHHHHGG